MVALMFGATLGSVLDVVGKVGAFAASLPPVRSYLAGATARMAGMLPLPENQDLVRTIRAAHLGAIDQIARHHAAALEAMPPHELDDDEHAFGLLLRAWLGDRLRVLDAGALDIAMVDEGQIKHLLDDVFRPDVILGYAEAAQKARLDAEKAALEEVAEGAGRQPPPLFRRLFTGEGKPGWHATFTTLVSEQLKTNERFGSIFVAHELIDIKLLIGAVEANLSAEFAQTSAAIDGRFDSAAAAAERHTQKVLRSNEGMQELIKELIADKHVPAMPLQALLKRLSGFDIAPADIVAQLERFADQYLNLERQLATRQSAVPEIEAGRAKALNLLRAGDLDGAKAVLADLDAKSESVATQGARNAAIIKADRAEMAVLEFDYRGAVAFLDQAAQLVTFNEQASALLRRHAEHYLYLLGLTTGDDEPLRQARSRVQARLDSIDRDTNPLLWGEYQNSLAVILTLLGERGEAGALDAALVAYGAALQVTPRSIVPVARGSTLSNLGTVLRALGERGNDRALRRSVAAFRLARITLHGHQHTDAYWSAVNNHGHTLMVVAQNDRSALSKAVAAFRRALSFRNRAMHPRHWAMTMYNLGSALSDHALHGDKTFLPEAVSVLEAALEVRTRARLPFEWAITMVALAGTLARFGQDHDDGCLRRAEQCCRDALTVLHPTRTPAEWASAEHLLGGILETIAEHGDNAPLRDAIAAYRAALEVFERPSHESRAQLVRESLAKAEAQLRHRGG